MMETLKAWDTALFLWLNSLHASWADRPFALITATATWLPFYALIVAYLLYRFAWRRTLMYLAAIALLITAADQFASGLMKPTIKRLRPCYEPNIKASVHTPVGCGGDYGFISSHAANTFALAMFLTLLVQPFPEHKKVKWLMLAWATVVSYSRIYVGVHYPADLLGGALVGVLFAWLLWRGLQKLDEKYAL